MRHTNFESASLPSCRHRRIERMCYYVSSGWSVTLSPEGDGLAGWGGFTPVSCKLELTRLSWYVQSGYNQTGTNSLTGEIGTSGCEASPDRYGAALNRSTRANSVRCTLNRRISLSRPPLPTKRKLSGGGLAVSPTKTAPREGFSACGQLSFLP
jgi:hypothetical protein